MQNHIEKNRRAGIYCNKLFCRKKEYGESPIGFGGAKGIRGNVRFGFYRRMSCKTGDKMVKYSQVNLTALTWEVKHEVKAK